MPGMNPRTRGPSGGWGAVILAVCCCCSSVRAGQPGSTAANFLKLGAGRSIASAGAGCYALDVRQRRFELGKILVVERCDPQLIPITSVVVTTTKDAELINAILKVVLPEEMGPPIKENIDGTLNFSLGSRALEVRVQTALQYANNDPELLAKVREDLGARLAVVYRDFNPD